LKWGHDKIQQSAYALLPEGKERELLHLKVGLVLKALVAISPELFMAAEQLNKASHLISDKSDKVDLIQLNLEAADSVMEKSALVPASQYLRSALNLACDTNEGWTSHYELLLSICVRLADIECSLGNFQACEDLILQVLTNARNEEDKIPGYFAQVESFIAQGYLFEAIEFGISTMNNLGEDVPSKPSKAQISSELKMYNGCFILPQMTTYSNVLLWLTLPRQPLFKFWPK
jgi:predicted ATPase